MAAALNMVRRDGRVRVMEVAAELGIGMRAARGLIDKMVNDRIVGQPDNDGWHRPVEKAAKAKPEAAAPPRPPNESYAAAKIRELEERIERLKQAGKIVIAEREEWKAKAERLEQMVGQSFSKTQDRRFAELKNLIANEFHPDRTQGSGVDKLIREAIFKHIWQHVQRIERN